MSIYIRTLHDALDDAMCTCTTTPPLRAVTAIHAKMRTAWALRLCIAAERHSLCIAAEQSGQRSRKHMSKVGAVRSLTKDRSRGSAVRIGQALFTLSNYTQTQLSC